MKNLAHTFSVVARDPQNGQLGVAVQSHWFAVGALCPWAEAGVGAIATQSLVDPSYGVLGLNLLRTGRSAVDVLAELLEKDQNHEAGRRENLPVADAVARCRDSRPGRADALPGQGQREQAVLRGPERQSRVLAGHHAMAALP